MEAVSGGEIRTDEPAALDVSIRPLLSSRAFEPCVYNQEADVQGVLGLWRRICTAKSLSPNPYYKPLPHVADYYRAQLKAI